MTQIFTTSRVIIEIVGVHDKNKGALLMLEAVCNVLRAEVPQAMLAVPFSVGPETRLRLGLWVTVPPEFGPFDASVLAELVPRRLRRAAALVRPSEVDVLLDASGFGYGDYWGETKLRRRLVSRVRKLYKRGRRIVLLPQALGPFESSGMSRLFSEVVEKSDLVFVRDAQSERFVRQVAPAARSLRRAPDFTSLLQPELPRALERLRGVSLVIPNRRVEAPSGKYLDFLELSVRMLLDAGRRVAVLVHEGDDDRTIAEQLNVRLGQDAIEIVEEPSALVTKAIISAADLVVSSRFHGLVSALSSGVPAVACGWSHKYEELMADYHSSDYLVKLDDDMSWRPLLTNFLGDGVGATRREQLGRAAENERAKSIAMWREIVGVLQAVS